VVAGALALACSGANAALLDVAGAPIKYSIEGLQSAGGDVTLPDVQVTTENAYSFNDVIEVSLTGASASTPNDIDVTCLSSSVGDLPDTKPNVFRFRITDPAGTVAGETCDITGLEATASSIANNATLGVCWTVYFGSSTTIVDEGCTSKDDLTAANQLTIKVNEALNGVIDVEADRKLFVDEGEVGFNDTETDTLRVAITTSSTGFTAPLADVAKETIVLMGDFSWADTSDAGTTCSVSELDDWVAQSEGAPPAFVVSAGSDCTKVILASSDVEVADNHSAGFTITVPTTKVLAPQTFSGSIKWDYTVGAKAETKTTNFAPGAWTINGALIRIAYMPYGDNISQIIYVSNRGGATSDIDVDYITDTGAAGSFTLAGAAKAGSVTAIAGAIKAGLEGKGVPATSRVDLTLVLPVSDRFIEVYSAYNVGGSDRGTVVNNSNGRSFFYGTGVNFNGL
jgi:hypothetical protein